MLSIEVIIILQRLAHHLGEYNGILFTITLKGISKNSDFVTTLCYSKKILPYISTICCVNIFFSRLILFETLNS